MATVLGLASGGAAWVLLRSIAVLTNLALFHRWGTTLPNFRDLPIGPGVVLVAVAGAAVVSLMTRWAPLIRGHGIPEAMDAVLTGQSRVAPRTAVAKPVSAAVAIGTGGPFGAEGPIIVTGMAATFGTPLAAVVLAIELLLFEFSPRAFIPLAVATSVAGGVHVARFGSGPLFAVPAHDFSGLSQLPLFAALGLSAGCSR